MARQGQKPLPTDPQPIILSGRNGNLTGQPISATETTGATDNTTGTGTNGTVAIAPQTSDNSNTMPWIVLLLLSSGGLTGDIIHSRKRKAS